ncbi:hypothetical protein ACB092_03G180700, partial [Castanea dentata]
TQNVRKYSSSSSSFQAPSPSPSSSCLNIDRPQYPKVQQHVTYNNDYEEERVTEAPRRVRLAGYEYAPQYAKLSGNHVHKAVDEEAEDFIKLEHKKFETSKMMSMRSR